MPVVGGVFGGIHCIGWFFDFPSSAEAMLWRVSSAVLTGIASLFPIIFVISVELLDSGFFGVAVVVIIVLVYVVSRLLLIVEAFISRRVLLLVRRISISCYRLYHDVARSNLKCTHL